MDEPISGDSRERSSTTLALPSTAAYYPPMITSQPKSVAIRGHAVDVDGRTVFYREARPRSEPQGDMILIHGWIGTSSWMFRYLLPELGRRYRVLALDLPGYGRSEVAAWRPSIFEYGEFISRFTERLDVGRFHLLGISVGGTIALHFAHKYPEHVRKLVLQGPVYRGRDLPRRLHFIYRTLGWFPLADLVPKVPLKWWFFIRRLGLGRDTSGLSPDDRRRLASDILRVPNQTLINVGRELIGIDQSEEARNICVPTLIVDGADARLMPASAAQHLHSLIPGSRLLIVPDCGHNLALEKPQELLGTLLPFLEDGS
ncbi:MAG: alpha/beta fold hydrolase [Dehalococcoidia bacterium]